jgi:hypothetical protein
MLIYQHSLKFVIRWALQSVYFQRKSLVLLIYSSICKFRYVSLPTYLLLVLSDRTAISWTVKQRQ